MILVDKADEKYLKLSFKYSEAYVSLMKTLKSHVHETQFDPIKKLWYFPIDKLSILEKYIGERLVWITPKWKIYNLEKPDYTDLYNITLHDLPKLQNLTLFKYQEFGANFMIDRLEKYGFAVNCFDTGLGKSIVSVVVQEWMRLNKNIKKTILICPKMIKEQWREEVYEAFAPWEKTFIVNTGLDKNKRDIIYSEFNLSEAGTLILNFHLFLYDQDMLKTLKLDYAVIDEAQDIATHDGKMNVAIKSVVGRILYLTILTATPIKSKPDNLYAVFSLKDSSILGKWNAFNARYIDYEDTKYGLQKIGYKNLPELKDTVDKYVIRVTEHEVDMELPDVITKVYRVEPDAAQVKMLSLITENTGIANDIYLRAKIDDEISDAEKEKLYGRVMLHIQAGRAVADDPRLIPMSQSEFIRDAYSQYIPKNYKMSPKTELCIELVREIIDGNFKAVIFTEFEREARLLQQDLQKAFKFEIFLLVTGETDSDDDILTIRRFRSDPDCKILIGTSALQTGQNLQVASFIIHFDLPQSQDGIVQRMGRARRVGSKHKNIKEYVLITKDSLEVTKFDRLKIQQRMSDEIFSNDAVQSEVLRAKSN